MAFGLDYVSGPSTAVLQANKVAFVCRYLSEVNALTQVKLLTPDEAKMLSAAGIAIVSNYEWYASRATESSASGVYDAQIAASQHKACGGPDNRPIYFSVDEDVSGDLTAGYFRGVSSVIGLARTGAYGSYRVIKYLLDNSLVKWAWQTYAWSGGQWDQRAHIRQYQNGMMLAGKSVDYNESMQTDFGQWTVGEEDMMNITDPFASRFFTQVSTGPTRWQCNNGQSLFAGILQGWRLMNGAPRLPIGPETSCGKQAVYQECEAGIVVYDPANELDTPGGPWSPCYLLKFDSPLAKQILGQAANTTKIKADIQALQNDVNAL